MTADRTHRPLSRPMPPRALPVRSAHRPPGSVFVCHGLQGRCHGPSVEPSTALAPPARPWRRHALWLLVALLGMLLSTGCRTTDEPPAYLGRPVDHAPMLWIEPYRDETLGNTLRYREILDLEAFVARAEGPVLLIVRDTLDGTGPTLIPQAETLAYETGSAGSVAFIDQAAADTMPDLLEPLTAPAYYLFDGASRIAQAEGPDTEAIEHVLTMFRALLEDAP